MRYNIAMNFLRKFGGKPMLSFFLSFIIAVGLLTPALGVRVQATVPCYIDSSDTVLSPTYNLNSVEDCYAIGGSLTPPSPVRASTGIQPQMVDCFLPHPEGTYPAPYRLSKADCEAMGGTWAGAGAEVIGPPVPPTTSGINGTPSDIGRTGITGTPSDIGEIVNPLGSNNSTIMEFIQNLLIGAIKIGMPIIALAIIYCGFLFVSARGNSEKVQKAKDALLYTVIGSAILLGSWAIAMLISETVLSLY